MGIPWKRSGRKTISSSAFGRFSSTTDPTRTGLEIWNRPTRNPFPKQRLLPASRRKQPGRKRAPSRRPPNVPKAAIRDPATAVGGTEGGDGETSADRKPSKRLSPRHRPRRRKWMSRRHPARKRPLPKNPAPVAGGDEVAATAPATEVSGLPSRKAARLPPECSRKRPKKKDLFPQHRPESPFWKSPLHRRRKCKPKGKRRPFRRLHPSQHRSKRERMTRIEEIRILGGRSTRENNRSAS